MTKLGLNLISTSFFCNVQTAVCEVDELVDFIRFTWVNGDALAFGDNYNDVDMLREAGIGVAVENAIPEAKAVADEITAPGKEDGVARSIEAHFQLHWTA